MRRKFRRIFEKEKGSNASNRGQKERNYINRILEEDVQLLMHHDLTATNMTSEIIVIQSR
jgi:hypothetical protein